MSARILVVDDEQDMVDLLTYNLKQRGYEVLAAHVHADPLRIQGRRSAVNAWKDIEHKNQLSDLPSCNGQPQLQQGTGDELRLEGVRQKILAELGQFSLQLHCIPVARVRHCV